VEICNDLPVAGLKTDASNSECTVLPIYLFYLSRALTFISMNDFKREYDDAGYRCSEESTVQVKTMTKLAFPDLLHVNAIVDSK
jgi:hypothetical protein